MIHSSRVTVTSPWVPAAPKILILAPCLFHLKTGVGLLWKDLQVSLGVEVAEVRDTSVERSLAPEAWTGESSLCMDGGAGQRRALPHSG